VVGVRAAQGGPTAALHVRSIEGKHAEAEAVSEAGVELPAFEPEGSGEWESIQPRRGEGAGAGEESGPGRSRARLASSVHGGKGGMQSSARA
jgi:hypothetical protein